MTILLVGGGSGGHIIPLLAVARELKKQDPQCRIVYVGERGLKFLSIAREERAIDDVALIRAGKLRRYPNESWLRQILDIKTILLNLRDIFYTFVGFFQALRRLKAYKPDIVMIKGGFVGVPVGLACAVKKVRFITHDSDTIPGLANRIISKWAYLHAVGMPESFYNYPAQTIRYVGIPLSEEYTKITPKVERKYKEAVGIPLDSQLLTITGGSQGAQRLNQSVQAVIPRLLESSPKLYIVHQVGKGNNGLYNALPESAKQRVQEYEFLNDLHTYTGAADAVITRAGANTISELAVQAKATIIVPSPYLAGGHQLQNAQYLQDHEAALVLDEATILEEPAVLYEAVKTILTDTKARERLANNLHALMPRQAAHELAKLLLVSSK